MNRKEYKQLTTKFIVALRARMIKEGYDFRPEVIRVMGDYTYIKLADCVYRVFNNGDYADWELYGKL